MYYNIIYYSYFIVSTLYHYVDMIYLIYVEKYIYLKYYVMFKNIHYILFKLTIIIYIYTSVITKLIKICCLVQYNVNLNCYVYLRIT